MLNKWRRRVASDSRPLKEEEPIYQHPRIARENSFYLQLREDTTTDHNYTWGVIQAASLARDLHVPKISVIEFGVAGGTGLIALENIAEKAAKHYGTEINVYGFDTGTGLPQPKDYRDLPDLLTAGEFPMDEQKLRDRLRGASLFLGIVAETLRQFIALNPPPVGFIAFDMDFYSSTMDAFKLLECEERLLLPRIYCFFDDIFACGDFNGERLAIADFNSGHGKRKISHIYGLQYFLPYGTKGSMPMLWEKYYMAYIFDHSLYGRNLVGPRPTHLQERLK